MLFNQLEHFNRCSYGYQCKSNFVTAFPRKIFYYMCTIDSMDLNFAVDCIWLILQSECNRLDWREYWLLQTCLLCIQRFRLRKVISYGILTISIRVIVTFRMTHGTFQLINMYNSNEMKFYFLRFGKKKTTFSLVYLLICWNSRTQYIANTKSQYRYTFQSFWYRF